MIRYRTKRQCRDFINWAEHGELVATLVDKQFWTRYTFVISLIAILRYKDATCNNLILTALSPKTVGTTSILTKKTACILSLTSLVPPVASNASRCGGGRSCRMHSHFSENISPRPNRVLQTRSVSANTSECALITNLRYSYQSQAGGDEVDYPGWPCLHVAGGHLTWHQRASTGVQSSWPLWWFSE